MALESIKKKVTKRNAMTFYNWIRLLLPYANRDIYSSDAKGPTNMVDTLRRHTGDFKLNTEGLPDPDVFEKYASTRLHTIDGFSSIKIPNGRSLTEALQNTKQGPSIQDQIQQALSFSGKTTVARKNIRNALLNAKALAASDKSFYPGDLINALSQIKSETSTAIKQQHEIESKQFGELLNTEKFTSALKESLGKNVTDDQLKGIKRDMLATLKDKQSKSLASFEKEMNDKLNTLHAANDERERNRILFFAGLSGDNAETNAAIQALASKSAKAQRNNVALEATLDANRLSFKGLKPEDLQVMKTVGGIELHIEGNSVSGKLPHRWFGLNPFYKNPDNLTKTFYTRIAQGAKMQGYKPVVLNFNNANKLDLKYAEAHMRQFYRQMREVGYAPDEIKIKMPRENGKIEVISAEELFGSAPAAKKATDQAAKRYDDARKREKELFPNEFSKMKEELMRDRPKSQDTPPTSQDARASSQNNP